MLDRLGRYLTDFSRMILAEVDSLSEAYQPVASLQEHLFSTPQQRPGPIEEMKEMFPMDIGERDRIPDKSYTIDVPLINQ